MKVGVGRFLLCYCKVLVVVLARSVQMLSWTSIHSGFLQDSRV